MPTICSHLRPANSDSTGIAALGLAIFVVALGTNVSTPFLVLYRERLDLGPSATQAIFAVYVVGILLTLLVAGPLSDRFGRRAIVLPCLAMSAVASIVLIGGRDSYALLLVGRILLGVASGAALSVGSAWLLELSGPGKEARAAVLTTIVTFTGFGFGPVLSAGFDLAGAAPLVAPFILHAAIAVVSLAVVWKTPDPRERRSDGGWIVRLRVPPHARRIFVTTIVPAVIWTFAFPSTGFSLFPVLLADFADDNAVVVAAASGCITAMAGLIARPVVARLGASRGLVAALIIGVFGYALGTTAFVTEQWYPVILAAACLGAASGTLTASALTLVGEFADDESRGSLTSTMYLLAYPGMVMPIVLTSVASVSSIETALIGVTCVASIAALLVGRATSKLDLVAR